MKKLVLFLSMILFVVFAQAQIITVSDTLQGNETVNFTSLKQPGQVQVLCTQLGGTSDGTLFLQGSVDGTSFYNITETSNSLAFYPNDTLTITNGAVWLISVKDKPFQYFRVKGVGTASDTTLVTIKYLRK